MHIYLLPFVYNIAKSYKHSRLNDIIVLFLNFIFVVSFWSFVGNCRVLVFASYSVMI